MKLVSTSNDCFQLQVTIGRHINMVLEDTLLYSLEFSSTSSLVTIIPAVLIPVAIIIACFVLVVIPILIYIFNRRAKRKESYHEIALTQNASYSNNY